MREDKIARVILSSIALFIISLFAFLPRSMTNSNFSRKYKMDCATCHTVAPQLSRIGLEFRRLGYRFSSELKEKSVRYSAPDSEELFAQSEKAIDLMDETGCLNCHSVKPGQPGRDIRGVGSKMTHDELKSVIMSEKHPGFGMAQELSEEEIGLIVLFISSLTEAPYIDDDMWSYDFANFISVRGRTRFVIQKVQQEDMKNEFNYHDMTLYYLGPVNRHVTVFFETEFEEGFEPNVLAQGTIFFGNSEQYGYIKIGNMRFVRQGVASLDRPKTISSDLSVSGKAHLFALKTDQRGVEIGYGFNRNRTLVRLFVTNGLDSTGNGRPVGVQDLNSQKDFSIMVENLFGQKTTTSIAALYYHGNIPASEGDINFDRIGIYGSLAKNNRQNREDVRINGGVLIGYDDVFGSNSNDMNIGFMVGLDKSFGNQFYLSTRYDQFRPTDRLSNNITRSYTIGMMKQVFTYIRLCAEYQAFQHPNDEVSQTFIGEFYLMF